MSVRDMLERKGIRPKEDHLEVLENRWKEMQAMKSSLEHAQVDDADIGLRNIPGGDHVE